MPVVFYIDVPLGVAFCRGSGAVDYGQMLDFRARLRGHPDFRPEFKQLFDLREVSQFKVSVGEIREMAKARTFSATSRRVFLAEKDFVFGLSRMIEAYRDSSSERGFKVCREMKEALEWLALSGEPDSSRFPVPCAQPPEGAPSEHEG